MHRLHFNSSARCHYRSVEKGTRHAYYHCIMISSAGAVLSEKGWSYFFLVCCLVTITDAGKSSSPRRNRFTYNIHFNDFRFWGVRAIVFSRLLCFYNALQEKACSPPRPENRFTFRHSHLTYRFEPPFFSSFVVCPITYCRKYSRLAKRNIKIIN